MLDPEPPTPLHPRAHKHVRYRTGAFVTQEAGSVQVRWQFKRCCECSLAFDVERHPMQLEVHHGG
jgi:hypothetical protein